MTDSKTKQKAQRLRTFRKIHRFTGACLFVFFFVISISGLLLGWKKHSQGLILPKSQRGVSTNPKDWKPLDELQKKALASAQKEIYPDYPTKIDRMDVRPNKGIVKVTFKDNFFGLQLDLTTGEVLQIKRRNSDFIEKIHDGSILDRTLDTSDSYFKLFYTTIMGGSLLLFTITGFWLWFGPKRLRKRRELEQYNE